MSIEDFKMCTRCFQYKGLHGRKILGDGIACDSFEHRPALFAIPGRIDEKVRTVSFERSQDVRPFIKDFEMYGEKKALEMHPEARLES